MIAKIRMLLSPILIVLGIGFSSFCFQSEAEIEWSSDRKLTWEDFKGDIPVGKDKISAVTASGINISRYQWNGDVGKVTIKAVFNTKNSWARKSASEFVLKHEQGHFDITEIYTRKLRKRLNGKKFKRSTSSKELQCIIDEIELEKNTYQLLYDKETNHSRSREIQEKWDIKLAEELKALEKYKNTEVTIILKGK